MSCEPPGSDSSCGAKKGWRGRLKSWLSEHLPKTQPVVTLAVGIAAAWIGIAASNNAKEALDRSQRAWLVPRRFAIEEPFAARKPTELVLRYGNVGREPAIKVAQQVGAGSISRYDFVVPDKLQARVQEITAKAGCSRLTTSDFGTAAYPGVADAYSTRYKIEGGEIDDAVLSGEKFLLVVACFVYETSGKPRHTNFCGFLDPFHGEKSSRDWPLAYCPIGNSAD